MSKDKDAIDRPNILTDPPEEHQDVAGLYSWANLAGSKYRDFSHSRQTARANTRHRKDPVELPPENSESARLERRKGDRPKASAPAAAPSADASLAPAPRLGPRRLPLPLRKTARAAPEASRWSALKGIIDQLGDSPVSEPLPSVTLDMPSLALVSLAGGVGKTSLAASLSRSLASAGDQVLLIDTQSYGVLPLYFGARDLGHENMRAFEGPQGSSPIVVMTIDPDRQSFVQEGEDRLAERIAAQAQGKSQVLLDVSTGSTSLLRELLRLSPTVLVVLAPDMASMVSLQSLQALFKSVEEERKQPVEAHYLLCLFDASLQLHLDIRSALARQLGDKLLPFSIRRSSAMGEALAQGMTVQEYAANAEIVEDLNRLSLWIQELGRAQAPIAQPELFWRKR